MKCNSTTTEKGPDPWSLGPDMDPGLVSTVFLATYYCNCFCVSNSTKHTKSNMYFFSFPLFVYLFPWYKTEPKVIWQMVSISEVFKIALV
jgi:hypothetical protein